MTASPLQIEFPESLPVSGKRDEIMAAIAAHQVVIVCGETGSGKTTQLPKIALAMGRGRLNYPAGQRGKLIGHTQPRRIAASSVAKRIAQELKTPLGDVVGYKVRFHDRLGKDASVKLMTDGILLAETQTDPLFNAYDTLIIDEAHERSLNIDFLLGYLRQILPRRPDLKIIVTSATIDAQRFADHFKSSKGPAPVIFVSGRMFPVEQRYRPFEESREYDLNHAIADAVDELWRGLPAPGRPKPEDTPSGGSDPQSGGAWGPSHQGDILVFLPGEREIREAADHLRKHLSHQPVMRHAEVLPLFARLSPAEQDRIFDGHTGRRIVLATNVAETSLTVPGIRYVIDAGTARVKRYSFRSKVEQLLVEPISQAAANQRAGRCGRVAQGICIRLYDQQDFEGRPRFTDPEIVRSSLAGVILRMKSLHLGQVEDFPFLERPSGRAIADGYQLLHELGAVDDANALTPLGQELSRLPLDPRVGRMLLEARGREALEEVLVIASALSVQDVRDRPMDAQQQADAAHQKFEDEKSEFTGYLKLWKWIHDARGGVPAAQGLGMAGRSAPCPPPALRAPPLPAQNARPSQSSASAASHKLSNRQYEQLLRQHFINIRRVREWKDIYTQLHTVVAEHQWRLNTQAASYEQLHLSMLSGLLGNVGCKLEEGHNGEYLGARSIKFFAHPGAHLRKKPGKWIVAAELVETTRLFGRGIATIEPQWLEQVGGHLLKKQLLDPHWEKKAAEVVALERATLYGIVVYSGRRVNYSRVDMAGAREIFIREALVGHALDGPSQERMHPLGGPGTARVGGHPTWESALPFLAANRQLIKHVEELEHKARRQDVLVDDELIYAFYDQQLPADVCSGYSLERWYREESKKPQYHPGGGAAEPSAQVKEEPATRAGDTEQLALPLRRTESSLLRLTREALMRHEAAGITSASFPKTIRLGGVDCAATYLHAPGDARDGLTVTLPLFVLNQVNEERCEWLVPGMLKDKVQALLKTLHQRPRSRLVPLPETAATFAEALNAPETFGRGGLVEAVLQRVRAATSLDIVKADIKLDMLSPHFLMNFRVVDEHGRQLGHGRNLGALKAELGSQARGAFQALAGLKLAQSPPASPESTSGAASQMAGRSAQGQGVPAQPVAGAGQFYQSNQRPALVHSAQAATKTVANSNAAQNKATSNNATQNNGPSSNGPSILDGRFTAWTFGVLPELLEIRKDGQTLIGFPALIDAGDAVTVEVFDEPDLAAAKHRAGLRRLCAIQIKDALKYLEKNIPDLQKMAVSYMNVGKADNGSGGGTMEELRAQIIAVALDRAFLLEPLPTDEFAFKRRIDEGRGRLTLIANEVARMAGTILLEYATAARKIKDTKNAPDATSDAQQQINRLVSRQFLQATPWDRLQHLARYLKAITLRLDKYRADPARDAARLTELRPQEQRYWRLVAERKGLVDERMQEFRWLLEELRVSLFAQELRTPQPVSVKRLDKAWAQIQG